MTEHHQAARAALRLAMPSEAALLVGLASARIVAQDQREIPRGFAGIYTQLRVFDTDPYSKPTPSVTDRESGIREHRQFKKGGHGKKPKTEAQSGTLSAQSKSHSN